MKRAILIAVVLMLAVGIWILPTEKELPTAEATSSHHIDFRSCADQAGGENSGNVSALIACWQQYCSCDNAPCLCDDDTPQSCGICDQDCPNCDAECCPE